MANEDQYDFDGNGYGDVCDETGLTYEQGLQMVIDAQPHLDLLIGQEPTSAKVKHFTDELSMQSTIKWSEIHADLIEIIEAWQGSKMKYFSEYLKWHEQERLYRIEKSK